MVSPERKICSLERLVSLRQKARRAGRTVVHCHGCFDIVHPGHVHHLQFARSLGDVLVVSVSADPAVNKGANRPLIPDELRAANLAALQCVDWVYINPQPTAVELLETLEPDIYVKGREYEHNQDPRFLAERDAVAGRGGRVVFSSGDVIYSSTSLIGSLEHAEPFNDEKVRRYRQRYGLTGRATAQLVDRFRGMKAVVVGDFILDRYHFCEATGVASESPVMSLRALQQRDYEGGAGIIAAHLAGLGASATLVTALGDDADSEEARERLAARGVDVVGLRERRQLPVKHRYLVDDTKVFKVDEGAAAPLDSQAERRAADALMAAAAGADAVIFADFGYGLITSGLLDRVMDPLRRDVRVLTADVSGRRNTLGRFKSVDLLCPTEREVRETLHDFSSGLNAVVWQLLSTTQARNAIITLGKQGLLAFDQMSPHANDEPWERRLRSEYLPSLSRHAVDPLGCGDALLAAASLALAAGGSLQAAAMLGAAAAACEVEQLGNQPVSAEMLFGRLAEWPEARSAIRVA